MDKKSRFCLCQVKVHLQCTNIYERMYIIYVQRYLQQNYLFIRTMTRKARVWCLNIINYFVVGHLHTHLCIYAYVFLLRFYSQTLRPIYRTLHSNDSEKKWLNLRWTEQPPVASAGGGRNSCKFLPQRKFTCSFMGLLELSK